MTRDWMSSLTLGALPCVCTVIFLIAFAVMLISMFMPGSAKTAEKSARIPFDREGE